MPWLLLLKFGIPLIAGWIIYDFGSSWVRSYQSAHDAAAQCKNERRLRDARELSYKRMLERRDEAIAASKCSAQIKKWISNPDQIPKKFDPHNQLKPAGID